MANLPGGTHLAYIVWHEVWWHKQEDGPAINVKASAGPNGGAEWEFFIKQMHLGGQDVLHLEMFSDAYRAFTDIPEFFRALADDETAVLTGVREVLDSMGAVDETPRESPYAKGREPGGWKTEEWESIGRDGDGNLELRHRESGGVYRLLPAEEL